MADKQVCIVNTILRGIAIILLLAAAFDILPWADNVVIFAVVALFVVTWMVSRIAKASQGGGSCCK